MPFEVPSSWVWCKLEDYVKSVTDGDHQAPPKSDIGIPFLVISDVAKGKLNFLNTRFVPQEYYEKISFDRKPEKGDLLFTVTGSYGIVVPVNIDCKFCFQRHIGLIKTLNTNEYLLHLLKSSYIKGQCDEFATGTAQKTVGLETLRSFLLPIPPFAEQQRIVIEIEKWFSLIELIEGGKDDLQTTIKQAKSKILDLAIHGKLVPQDPNEEPAIKLLKRINPDFTPCDNGHYTQLPEGWAICKMKQITSITNGKSQKNVETLNGIYPIYGSGGVIGRANQYLCIAGSTIIGRKGTINNPIFVEEHFWNVDTAFGLKANDAILDKYLYYFCLSFDFSKLDKSTAMPSLTKTSIGNVLIPIPPYKEQERIVAKIDMVLDTMNEILRAV